jgi:acetyl esterase/lipase
MTRITPISVRDYLPSSAVDVPPLLWVHGGGFAGGGIDMPEADAVARRLAAAGQRVRTVDYRLAPALAETGPLAGDDAEGRYPAAQDDVIAALRDLAPHGDAFLGGASAGACIAASTALRLRDENRPLPRGLVLVYGLFHARFPVHRDAEGRRLREMTDPDADEWLRRMTLNYAGDPGRLIDPHVFPGEGSLEGLPPTLILDAQNDILRASGKRFAQRLRRARVRTREEVVADAEHGFLNEPESAGFETGTTVMRDWMLG